MDINSVFHQCKWHQKGAKLDFQPKTTNYFTQHAQFCARWLWGNRNVVIPVNIKEQKTCKPCLAFMLDRPEYQTPTNLLTEAQCLG